jgi:integrase
LISQESVIAESVSSDITIEQRIDSITISLSRPYFGKILKKLALKNKENATILCDYIQAEQTEFNIKDSTKEGKIKVLVWLSNFFEDEVSFKQMKKSDILSFLNKLRGPGSDDPTQKWIGSYNGRQIILNKFFRWLYNPDEPDHRRRITPACMQGIKRLPRRQKTSYKPSDIWESIEHATFLKYCPSRRDRCYHAMADDTSARPHELLNLKIKDINFHLTDEGKQYAEVRISEGKTGPRTVPLIDSLPYLKEYLQEEHPSGTNPDSWLFVSLGNNHGSKFTYEGLSSHYEYYKKRYFPSLLIDETVPEPDKSLIRNMLTKPWNLYVFRHSALTEKSQVLSEAVLRTHAGWTPSSRMPQVYIHLSDESTTILLEKKSLIRKGQNRTTDVLKPRLCPNCSEPNRQDVKFCFHCKMVLSYDSYQKTVNSQKEKEDKLTSIENEFKSMKSQLQILTSAVNSLNQTGKNELAEKLVRNGLYVT